MKYLSVQILNSQSRYIYTNVNTNSAKFDFTTDESGPYSICASNQFGSDLDIIFQLINGFDQNKRTKDVSITLEDIKFIRGINRDTRLHEELKDVYEKVLEEKAREKIKPIEIQDICASIFIFIFLGGIFYVYVQRGKQEKYKDY